MQILKIAKTLLERIAHEKFVGAKKMNIAVMKYAMELLDKEDERDRKRKAKEAEREAKLKKRQGLLADLSSGQRMLVQALFFMVLLTIWISFRGEVYGYLFYGGNNRHQKHH